MLPKKFKQVVVAIEMLTELNAMTIEELVSRLRMSEDADADDAKEVTTDGVGRLYLEE